VIRFFLGDVLRQSANTKPKARERFRILKHLLGETRKFFWASPRNLSYETLDTRGLKSSSLEKIVALDLESCSYERADAPDPKNSAAEKVGVPDPDKIFVAVISSASAALFGGIHVIAWNFAFTSTTELVLWRCASLYTAASPPCFVLSMFFVGMLSKLQILKDLLISIPPILYAVARLYIIVEMFRTLCFLPPSSYISTWTSNVPHLS
jgi:hypothetical protein